ncbi:hypothetical protein NQZ68_026371 [Dissostichus eleginoides]|nr:hypothetical protein NQZ68_026371 [Dissostichus eleginoides]
MPMSAVYQQRPEQHRRMEIPTSAGGEEEQGRCQTLSTLLRNLTACIETKQRLPAVCANSSRKPLQTSEQQSCECD